jgi:integrase
LPRSEYTVRNDFRNSTRRWGLRHLRATYLLIAGVHPVVVSKRLGHSNPSITMGVYSHGTPGLQEGAALAFEATLKALTGRAEAANESDEDRG